MKPTTKRDRAAPAGPWMPSSVALRAVESLIPYARNARTHSAAQVAQIAASIREFGWTNPVLVSADGTIIAGHGRVLAARQIGLVEVPTIELGHLNETQRRALVLADNQLALTAGWDDEMLATELRTLLDDGFALPLLGFDDDVVAGLLAEPTEGMTDPDDTPDVQAQAIAVLGDVWLLGNHRLVCGDSTDADTVAKCLGPVKPHIMVTDPPYGVEYDASWRNEALRSDGSGSDGRAVGAVANDDRADWREAWALFPGDVAYVWHAGVYSHHVALSLESCDFQMRALVVWAKGSLVIGRGHYHHQHEPCWYAVRKGATGHWTGDRKQTTLWQIPKPQKSETGHSTQKPVECMKRPIENNSSPGQAVYEPFSGSGTTIIAGEMTARSVHAIELNPAYVDVAIRRWQAFTGKQATLEGDGRTFDQLAAERTTP